MNGYSRISARGTWIWAETSCGNYAVRQGRCPARVARGPLTGTAGRIVNKEEQHMFLVNIEILGRSVGVKVFAGDIEPD